MGIHIPSGFGQVAMVMTWASDLEEMVCTFGIEVSEADADQVAQDIFDDAGLEWRALLSEVVTLDRVEVTTPTTLGVSTGESGPGILDDNVTPQNVSVLVDKLTGLRGRSKRGRMYIPGVNLARLEVNGALTTTGRNAYQTDINTFAGAVVAVDNVVGLRLLHSDPSEAPDDLTALTIDPVAATQRRRLR